MPSPVGRAHGRAQVPVIAWLDYYAEHTPGVEVLDNATTILGWKSEPQPDVMLRILPRCGGRTRDQKGVGRGAPELVVEVAKATRYVDLGPKLTDYEQAGGLECIVRALGPDEILWFEHRQGALAQRPMDADGIYRSVVFPGLWLDPKALVKGNRPRLRAVVDLGSATPEHAAFVARLAAAREKS
jgi:Uma2 family endonuclease